MAHRLKRGAFQTPVGLQAPINRFVADHDTADSKIFPWIVGPRKDDHSHQAWAPSVGCQKLRTFPPARHS